MADQQSYDPAYLQNRTDAAQAANPNVQALAAVKTEDQAKRLKEFKEKAAIGGFTVADGLAPTDPNGTFDAVTGKQTGVKPELDPRTGKPMASISTDNHGTTNTASISSTPPRPTDADQIRADLSGKASPSRTPEQTPGGKAVMKGLEGVTELAAATPQANFGVGVGKGALALGPILGATAKEGAYMGAKGVAKAAFEAISKEGATGATIHTGQGAVTPEAGKAAVSMFPDLQVVSDTKPTQQEIQAYVKKNEKVFKSDDRIHLGMWKEGDKWYMEPSVRTDKKQAIEIGSNGRWPQKAIFDEGTMADEPIPTKPAMVKGDIKTVNTMGHPFEAKAGDALTEADLKAAETYHAAPAVGEGSKPAWDSLIADTEKQYDEIAKEVKIIPVADASPYKTAKDMAQDVKENGELKVSTLHNEHPYWTPEQNLKFRAVHDYVGHIEGGNDFSMAGENLAYHQHAALLEDPLAKEALHTEVVGQASAALTKGGEFQGQKVFLPSKEGLADTTLPSVEERMAMLKESKPAPSSEELYDQSWGTGVKPEPPGPLLSDKDYKAAQLAYDPSMATRNRKEWNASKVKLASDIAYNGMTEKKWAKLMPEGADGSKWKQLYTDAADNLDQQVKWATEGQMPSTARLTELYNSGAYLKDWYVGAKEELEKQFGPDADMMARFIAATSPQIPVTVIGDRVITAKSAGSNMEKARNAYREWKTGVPFTGGQGIVPNLERAAAGKEFDWDSSPKVASFYKNIMGDENAITADGWMGKMFGYDATQITGSKYQFIEQAVTRFAEKMGVPPAHAQAALWVGYKVEQGLRDGEMVDKFGTIINKFIAEHPEGFPKGMSESGKASLAMSYLIARATLGGMAGATTAAMSGADPDAAIAASVAGAGLGALSPYLVKRAVTLMKEVAPAVSNEAKAVAAAKRAIPQDMTATRMSDMQDRMKAALMDRRPGLAGDKARTDEVVSAEAKALLKDLSSPEARINYVKSIGFNTPLSDEKATAMLKIVADEGAKLKKLAQAAMVHDGPDMGQMAKGEFLKQFEVMTELIPTSEGVESAAGRSLRVMQGDNNFANSQFIKNLSQTMASMTGEGMSVERLAQMVSKLHDPTQLALFAGQAAQAKGSAAYGMFMEAWINGLLYNPKTHVANALSNTSVQLWSVAENVVAKGIGKITGTRYAPGEEVSRLKGIVEGLGDAWNYVGEAVKDPSIIGQGGNKLDNPVNAISSKTLGLTGDFGRAVDFLGTVARGSGTAMMAADDMFKAVAYRTELRVQANREAFERATAKGLTGDAYATEFNKIQQDVLNNPKTYAALHDAATNYASYATFTGDLTGIGKDIQMMAGKYPAFKLLLPFIRTPGNIFKYAGERTFLGAFSTNVRAEIAAGGARRDLALAKMALGSTTAALMTYYAGTGLITGGGPADPKALDELKQTGWRPYSLHVGKEYYSIQRLQPLSMILQVAADMRDFTNLAIDSDQNTADHLAAAGVAAISRNITSQSFLMGAAKFIAAAASPDVKQWEQYLNSFAQSMVPASGLMRDAAQQVDPEVKEYDNVWQAIKGTVPYLSKDVPAKHNAWGERKHYDESLLSNMASPIMTSVDGKDPAMEKLVRHDITIGQPSKTVAGVHLSSKAYGEFGDLIGTVKAVNDQTLKEAATDMTQSEVWNSASKETKKTMIGQLVGAYRKLALNELRDKYTDLDNALNAAGEARASYGDENKKQSYTQGGIPKGLGIGDN